MNSKEDKSYPGKESKMERNQFTFYASYLEAIEMIPDDLARLRAYEALTEYALRETLPDPTDMPVYAAIVFKLIRPTIDTGRRKAMAGHVGGQYVPGRAQESNAQANAKQNASEIEIEKEIEKEVEVENEGESPRAEGSSPASAPALPKQKVLSYYRRYINRNLPERQENMLLQYTQRLSEPVVINAMDEARSENKSSWCYVRAILDRYEREGLRSIEAVRQAEKQRQEQQQTRASPGLSSAEKPIDLGALQDLLEHL